MHNTNTLGVRVTTALLSAHARPCTTSTRPHARTQVTKGMDVVQSIEKVKCRDNRPLVPIKIINMECK